MSVQASATARAARAGLIQVKAVAPLHAQTASMEHAATFERAALTGWLLWQWYPRGKAMPALLRVLELGRIAGLTFVLVQLVAILRIVAELRPDAMAWQAAAALAWVLAFLPWALRSTWIYLTRGLAAAGLGRVGLAA